MGEDLQHILYVASTWVLPAVLAITLHEAAHGFVAWRLGDDTAYRMGRVTFNPFRHMDLFGTFILPAILIISPLPLVFGYAKPVPVAFARLRSPRRDMMLVAAAGPAANLMIALVSAILMNLAVLFPGLVGEWVMQNLVHSILINLLLAIFNMLPLPPLDGGRVAVGLLPTPAAVALARFERYGILVLLGAIFLLPYVGREMGVDLDLFRWLIWDPVMWLMSMFLALSGH